MSDAPLLATRDAPASVVDEFPHEAEVTKKKGTKKKGTKKKDSAEIKVAKTSVPTKAYVFRLRPTRAQRKKLGQYFSVSRYAWNWTVARCRQEYQDALATGWKPGKQEEPRGEKPPSINRGRLYKAFCEFRESEAMWLHDVHSHVYSYAIERVVNAYVAWWKALKEGRRGGPPKFKSRGKAPGSFTIQVNAGALGKEKLRIPKFGWVSTRAVKPCNRAHQDPLTAITSGTPCQITVREMHNGWQASVTVKNFELPTIRERPKSVLGIDFGVKAVTLSDGRIIPAPRPLERSLRMLKRCQRQESRKKRGSNRHALAKRRISQLHARVAAIRADFLHKLTHSLVQSHTLIVIEGMNIADLVGDMDRKATRRRMLDGASGELRRQLQYKGKWMGTEVIIRDATDPTDQTCHSCGQRNKMPDTTSRYACAACGLVTTRQLNTAKLNAAYGRGDAPRASEILVDLRSEGPNGEDPRTVRRDKRAKKRSASAKKRASRKTDLGDLNFEKEDPSGTAS